MNVEQAYQLLGITQEDDSRTAKMKFRRLIGRFHPDAIGSDLPEHTRRAQELNMAYQIVKSRIRSLERREQEHAIQMEVNAQAFCERNIYMEYHMDLQALEEEEIRVAKDMYQQVGRGKYYWDPDEEEFLLFLKSIHHAVLEVLKENALEHLPLEHQIPLFGYLASQFIKPLDCLRQLAEPKYVDDEGREVYAFRAFLGAKPGSAAYEPICHLHKEDVIYPDAIKNNRIMVSDGMRHPLGFISLEDDALNFCLIPLLRAHKAHVKMHVQAVDFRQRRYPVRANIRFLVRVEKLETFPAADYTERIRELIEQYRSMS